MKSCREGHDFRGALGAAGLRATPRRLAVLDALHDRGALSADDIAVSAGISMDRATAYRTVEALVAAGILSPAGGEGRAARYELADHHTHIVTCVGCGLEAKLDGCGLEQLDAAALRAAKGFSRITGHSLSWRGLCRKCSRRSA
jgi:Fe2+ or Zn2+ uptake regulation protein